MTRFERFLDSLSSAAPPVACRIQPHKEFRFAVWAQVALAAHWCWRTEFRWSIHSEVGFTGTVYLGLSWPVSKCFAAALRIFTAAMLWAALCNFSAAFPPNPQPRSTFLTATKTRQIFPRGPGGRSADGTWKLPQIWRGRMGTFSRQRRNEDSWIRRRILSMQRLMPASAIEFEIPAGPFYAELSSTRRETTAPRFKRTTLEPALASPV